MHKQRKEVFVHEAHVLARISGDAKLQVIGYSPVPAKELNPRSEYARLMRLYGPKTVETFGEYIDGRLNEVMENGHKVFGTLKVYKPAVEEDEFAEPTKG